MFEEIANAVFKKRHSFEHENMKPPRVIELYLNNETYFALLADREYAMRLDLDNGKLRFEGFRVNRCVNADAVPYRILVE